MFRFRRAMRGPMIQYSIQSQGEMKRACDGERLQAHVLNTEMPGKDHDIRNKKQTCGQSTTQQVVYLVILEALEEPEPK